MLGEPGLQTPKLYAAPCCCGFGLGPQRRHPSNRFLTLMLMAWAGITDWGVGGPQCSGSGPQSQEKDVAESPGGLAQVLPSAHRTLRSTCTPTADLTFPLRGQSCFRFPVANRNPALQPAPHFLPDSAPSQAAAPYLPRCSGQESGRHFHSFHSATLNEAHRLLV